MRDTAPKGVRREGFRRDDGEIMDDAAPMGVDSG